MTTTKYYAATVSVEECAQKCLLSSACDMFYIGGGICFFYPNIKMKEKITAQVTVRNCHRKFA